MNKHFFKPLSLSLLLVIALSACNVGGNHPNNQYQSATSQEPYAGGKSLQIINGNPGYESIPSLEMRNYWSNTVVRIISKWDNGELSICSGTALTTTRILTAAHCLVTNDAKKGWITSIQIIGNPNNQAYNITNARSDLTLEHTSYFTRTHWKPSEDYAEIQILPSGKPLNTKYTAQTIASSLGHTNDWESFMKATKEDLTNLGRIDNNGTFTPLSGQLYHLSSLSDPESIYNPLFQWAQVANDTIFHLKSFFDPDEDTIVVTKFKDNITTKQAINVQHGDSGGGLWSCDNKGLNCKIVGVLGRYRAIDQESKVVYIDIHSNVPNILN